MENFKIDFVQSVFNFMIGDDDYLIYFTPTESRNCVHVKIVKNSDLIYSEDKPKTEFTESNQKNAYHFLTCFR